MQTVNAIQLQSFSTSIKTGVLMSLCLMAADVIGLLSSVAISITCKFMVNGSSEISNYLQLWPFLFLFLFVYWLVGLYSDFAVSPPEELRRSTIASTVVFLSLAAVTVSMRGGKTMFTWSLFLAILLSVVLVPIMRACVRSLLAREDWWGYHAVVFGGGTAGPAIVKALQREPGLGFRPVALLDNNPANWGQVEGLSFIGHFDMANLVLASHPNAYALVAMSGMPHDKMGAFVENVASKFSRMLIISDSSDFNSLLVSPKTVGSFFGLELRPHVTLVQEQWLKRVLDVTLTAILGLAALPFCILIALLIKLEAGGPILYGHQRIGRGRQTFTAWKFRSMVPDADQVLEAYLRDNPEARAEWERTYKLKNDPRVTRIGKFLRKTSLDELPQLWNVLIGEMSLVGPRPIVQEEVSRYGKNFDLYAGVRGGVTGLWQVSGRNDTSYEDRVSLDTFYVRNWSVWLDLCILFRTVGVLLFRKGAY